MSTFLGPCFCLPSSRVLGPSFQIRQVGSCSRARKTHDVNWKLPGRKIRLQNISTGNAVRIIFFEAIQGEIIYAPPSPHFWPYGIFHLACCVPRIFSTLFLQYFVIFAKVIFGTPILIGFLGIFGDFGDFWWFWCFWWFSIISVILVNFFSPRKREKKKRKIEKWNSERNKRERKREREKERKKERKHENMKRRKGRQRG